MDAQSNSSKQDSSDRPSDTPNPSFEPRRMTVMQSALAPFAHLRSIQQQAEAHRAQERAEYEAEQRKRFAVSSGPMTAQGVPCSTKDLDNVKAKAQKDTSSSSQTPGTSVRVTRFEEEYNARRLAAAREGPSSSSLPLPVELPESTETQDELASEEDVQVQAKVDIQAQASKQKRSLTRAPSQAQAQNQSSAKITENPSPTEKQANEAQEDTSRSSETDKAKAAPEAQPSTQTSSLTFRKVQAQITLMGIHMAKLLSDKWNIIYPHHHLELSSEYKARVESFADSNGVELKDLVITPLRFYKSQAGAQAYYEALYDQYLQSVAPAVVQDKVDLQAQPPKRTESLTQAPSQNQAQNQSSSEGTEEPAPTRTQDTDTAQTQDTSVRMGYPFPTQNTGELSAVQKYYARKRAEQKTRDLAFVNAYVTIMEVSQAKLQATNWDKYNPSVWAHIKTNFEKSMEEFANYHGVDPKAVGINSIGFAKSQADAQAQYETLLSGAKVTAKLHAAVLSGAEIWKFEKAFSQFLTRKRYESAVQLVTDVLSLMEGKATSGLSSPDQAQSSSEKTENPAKVDHQAQPTKQTETLTQASSQDQPLTKNPVPVHVTAQTTCQPTAQARTQGNIPAQTQKDTSQPPADAQNAPKVQTPAKAPIQAQPPAKTQNPPQVKSKTPHPKLAFVQAHVKTCELDLAKLQAANWAKYNPSIWAHIKTNFEQSMEEFASFEGVDPQDVVINPVPFANSQAEAQALYHIVLMAQETGQYKPAPNDKVEAISKKNGVHDNHSNQAQVRQANKEIESLKKELAETRASQDQALKEFNAKSEKTRLEHLQQVDYFQRKITTGQVENQLLKTKLSKEESNSIHLRASLEKSEKEVERLREALKAKSEQKVRVPLPLETAQLPVQAKKTVQAQEDNEEKSKAIATLSKLENAIQAAVRASWKAKADEKAKAEAEEKAKIEATVPSDFSQIIALNKAMADEQAGANAQRHAEVLAAIQTTVQESFKAATENKVKIEAEEKVKIEAKAQIYAQAYVKAKNEAKAKARAEAEAENKAQSKPLCCPQSCSSTETLPKAQNSSEVVTSAQIQIQRLQSFIDKFTKSYHDSAEKYLEQIRCLEYDIQELTEDTDYKIEDLKKEVAQKDDKILELQKELWKVIDERQEARLDAEKFAMQLCTNNW
ncbi:hypothetical protein CAEBREN_05168 [Caenorhabditis brenneri]|uniref:Uncharacterized protein n=1 Tax=Caenorhabditis brenneri TaxID=135651 RepID=G0P4K6_CAEBE|nr:hypothetical protein CAEBREN_05168 [Caenorhabditis brenneri]